MTREAARTTEGAGPNADQTQALRHALGQFATGVTVITTRSQAGALVGLTANSFSALSLEPPLIVWSLRLSSSSLSVFQQAPRFVVNVLTHAQLHTSQHFATSQPKRFDITGHVENEHGLPVLRGSAAHFECRLVSHQIAGDHCLFIAEVERFSSAGAPPLLFHGGNFFTLGKAL